MASKAAKDTEVATADENDFENGEDEHLTDEERRNKRRDEWGDQFDIWLIRAAKKQRVIELTLDRTLPGITTKTNVVSCIPVRIDKFHMQVAIEEQEVWLRRDMILTAKHLNRATKPKATNGEE